MVTLKEQCEGVKGSDAFAYVEAWHGVYPQISVQDQSIRLNNLIIKVKEIVVNHKIEPDQKLDDLGDLVMINRCVTLIHGTTEENLLFNLTLCGLMDDDKIIDVEVDYSPLVPQTASSPGFVLVFEDSSPDQSQTNS